MTGRRRFDGLPGALQFLTRIPIRVPGAIPHERVVPWFPIVGVLIGALVGTVAVALGELVPAPVAATLAVVTGLLVTGAFHEDGLADIADAFGGGWTVEERLAILKDSRHGTYGVAAIAASVAVRIVCVATIAPGASLFASVVAAHALGRTTAVGAMRAAPPAAEHGLGVAAARALRPLPTVAGAVTAVGAVAALAGWWVAPFTLAALAGGAVVVWLAVRKIGGLAGDVLGAVEQVAECAVLVVASGLAARHQVWWA